MKFTFTLNRRPGESAVLSAVSLSHRPVYGIRSQSQTPSAPTPSDCLGRLAFGVSTDQIPLLIAGMGLSEEIAHKILAFTAEGWMYSVSVDTGSMMLEMRKLGNYEPPILDEH